MKNKITKRIDAFLIILEAIRGASNIVGVVCKRPTINSEINNTIDNCIKLISELDKRKTISIHIAYIHTMIATAKVQHLIQEPESPKLIRRGGEICIVKEDHK